MHALPQEKTPWPDFINKIRPGISDTDLIAVLPENISIEIPVENLDQSLKNWSGTWSGWGCQNFSCDIKIVVERVSATSATIAYGFAGHGNLLSNRTTARWANNELIADVDVNTRLVLRLRPSGEMEYLTHSKTGKSFIAGILAKNIYSKYSGMKHIDRVPTPFMEEGKPVTLEMIVFTPEGNGPFPTVVFNHGSTGRGDNSELFAKTWTSRELTNYFLTKGWQVVYPQRRGRGKSDGLYDEGFEVDRSKGYSCTPKLALPGLDRALEDIEAITKHLLLKPNVNKNQMLIGGQSRGGVLSIAFAGKHQEVYKGVINFVGGWSNGFCSSGKSINKEAFIQGSSFKNSTLWLYGDDDPFYSLNHSRQNFSEFRANGGIGDFLEFNVPGIKSGHSLITYPEIWGKILDKYLEKIK